MGFRALTRAKKVWIAQKTTWSSDDSHCFRERDVKAGRKRSLIFSPGLTLSQCSFMWPTTKVRKSTIWTAKCLHFYEFYILILRRLSVTRVLGRPVTAFTQKLTNTLARSPFYAKGMSKSKWWFRYSCHKKRNCGAFGDKHLAKMPQLLRSSSGVRISFELIWDQHLRWNSWVWRKGSRCGSHSLAFIVHPLCHLDEVEQKVDREAPFSPHHALHGQWLQVNPLEPEFHLLNFTKWLKIH